MLKELTVVLLAASLVSCKTSHKSEEKIPVKQVSKSTSQPVIDNKEDENSIVAGLETIIEEGEQIFESTGVIEEIYEDTAKLVHYGFSSEGMQYAEIIYIMIKGVELMMKAEEAYKNKHEVKIAYHNDPKCKEGYFLLDDIQPTQEIA